MQVYMSYRDQKKYLEALKRFESKFDRKELEEYKMFVKRQKDDEDFDSISMTRLKEMHDKYIKPVDASKYDQFFKKKVKGARLIPYYYFCIAK
jgi:hypothetical protein